MRPIDSRNRDLKAFDFDEEILKWKNFQRSRFFYYRRALRLFPLFYVVWVLCRMAGSFPRSVATFFYMGDYYTALTGHYSILTSAWSLGVEEKFYLLWPLLLVRLKGATRIKVLSGVLLFEPIYRSILTLAGFRTYTWFAFDTHLDAIVLGCLIAILVKEGWNPPQWLFHRATPWIALVLVFALQSQSDVVTYLLAVILISVVCRPAALLNSAVARYFGRISYALYLCHVYTSAVIWPRLCFHIHHQFAFVIDSAYCNRNGICIHAAFRGGAPIPSNQDRSATWTSPTPSHINVAAQSLVIRAPAFPYDNAAITLPHQV